MSQADLFIQQTRAQAAQQLSQPAAAFTGGIGGAQPGIMSYAAGKFGAFAGGFGAGMQQAGGGAMGRMAAVPASIAALATPGVRQFGDVIEGARYAGGGAPPMTLAGMLATGYAPTGLFPHAGMAFGMERGLRREMAREELGRRTTQGVRAGMHTIAHGATLGLSSYMMRRSGLEASWLTEMETERTLQNRMGFLRGGAYASATGVGVRRGFFQEGPGRAAVNVLQRRAGELQGQYGYGTEQMNMLTRMATGAIDVTRVQQAAAGGTRGMSGLGREISDIRETAAAMAREMQMSEKEIQEFFGRLKGVMKITGEGVREFRQENRRLSSQGPFSQRQVAEMRMQFTQMGRQMYMGGTDFGTEAMQQANRVAELRRSGVISAETLLREGGGLDPQAMARMVAQRLREQAGAVQGGNFNQALLLAGQDPEAYAGLMGGAGFFETQGAVGGVLARNPYALLQSQLDPNAVRRVTLQAPTIAFQRAQQINTLTVTQNQEQVRALMIRKFGGQMGYNVKTAQGLGKARVRYEELEAQRGIIEESLYDVFDPAGGVTKSEADIRQMSNNLMGIMADTGQSASTLSRAMRTIGDNTDLQRRWSSADAIGRTRIVKEAVAEEEAEDLYYDMQKAGREISEALGRDTARGIKKAQRWAIALEEKGVSADMINKAIFRGLEEWSITTESLGKILDLPGAGGPDGTGGTFELPREGGITGNYRDLKIERRVQVGQGKFEIQTQTMTMSTRKINRMIREKGIKSESELKKALAGLSGWKPQTAKELTASTGGVGQWSWKDQLDWSLRTGRGGMTVEDLKQAGMSRQEWARAQREGAGVFDLLRRAGIEEHLLEDPEALLNLEHLAPGRVQKLKKDFRVGPLVTMIERFGAGITGEQDFKSMTRTVGRADMRSFFKEYAASEAGSRRLGGKSFEEFLGQKPTERMYDLFKGMGTEEKRGLLIRSLTSAIEKSQRLINETKRGDTAGLPLHVMLDKEQLEAISGK